MENVKSQIESLLFISGRAMSVKHLSELIKVKSGEVEDACRILLEEYKEKKSGIQMMKNGSSYQMVTLGDNSDLIREYVKDETTGELSKPSLEALTIIAYRGPVSKTDIDRIRGINCSLILKNLSVRGLIESRHDSKKDEIYYNISFDFLRHLGLNSIEELPEYEKLNKDDTLDKILGEDGMDSPLIKSASS